MTNDHSHLLDEIQGLLAAPPGDPSLADIEDTLAAGYARAMALEADRWRLERQIGDLARGFADGTTNADTDELARLAREMSAADGALVRLRTVLVSLRDRARDIRLAS